MDTDDEIYAHRQSIGKIEADLEILQDRQKTSFIDLHWKRLETLRSVIWENQSDPRWRILDRAGEFLGRGDPLGIALAEKEMNRFVEALDVDHA